MTSENRKVYMDYMNGCPMDERVIEAMIPYYSATFASPSSQHSSGIRAREALEEARQKVAHLINAKEDIIFTSGATESNNLAITGAAHHSKKGNHIISTAIEHVSVLNPLKQLEKEGFRISFIPVDKEGIVSIETLKEEITDQTILLSVIYASGEIGTIEPIQEIGRVARHHNILFHVDATAAASQLPIDVEKENIDLLTLSSNALYGPKGVGALYVGSTEIRPMVLGGGQERGLRSGSENMPGIVGMGKACEICKGEMHHYAEKMKRLRDRLIDETLKMEETYLNGHRTLRLPNNASFRFSYIEGESIILTLDMYGISAATGSACTSRTLQPSHTLLALGLRPEETHGSLLLTLGRENTDEDVDYVLGYLPKAVGRLREMSPLVRK